ncbi:MAG: hypothetical protein H7249_15295 [Chitinophagaceae bacterium]|nr:hypothetical protein [Oligoflexus sp.]
MNSYRQLAIGVLASLPLGIGIFWSMYSVRLRDLKLNGLQKPKKAVDNEPVLITFGLGLHDNPLAPQPFGTDRRVLKPRQLEAEKQRILKGRGSYATEESEHKDQWHE